MKQFFHNLGYKIRTFMAGRHGSDELNRLLMLVALVLMLVSCIPVLRWLYLVALAVLGYCLFRTFSRNLAARQRERSFYLRIRLKIKQWFLLQKNKIRDRKTHRYLTCPGCRKTIRIKRPQKGQTIRLTCPVCSRVISKKY